LQAPVEVLTILDNCDKGVYLQNIDMKKHFSFARYPFKQEWIAYDPRSMHLEKDEDDSVATHPDCKVRITAVKRQMAKLRPAERKQIVRKNIVKEKSYFEIIESQYHFKGYGRALFNALLLASRYPKNTFAHAMVVKCMYQLYVHQKNHELGKVIALPDSRFDENYDRYLTCIHALRLGELASLAYEYASSKKSDCSGDEEFLYAYWLCSGMEVSKEAPEDIKSQYLNRFPEGKYTTPMH
jgi:hypothetical protein